jgi:hypothetical protein
MIDGREFDRGSLIDALDDEFAAALVELQTADLEKLYTRFIVRSAKMELMLHREVM